MVYLTFWYHKIGKSYSLNLIFERHPKIFPIFRGPLSCQFMQEPDAESESEAIRGNFTGGSGVEQGAVQTSQFVDSVRHIYLGKKPFIIKECTRCLATSLPLNSHKKALNKGWDLRWASKCHCGGPWKLNCLNDNTGQKRNLLSSCI